MALCTLDLEMIDHIHKYFGDFYNFISLVIRDESQKSKTCEGLIGDLRWMVGWLNPNPRLKN